MADHDPVDTPESVGPPADGGTPDAAGDDRPSAAGRWFRRVLVCTGLLAATTAAGTYGYVAQKYAYSEEMIVPIEERDTFSYPEDPSPRSTHQGQYQGRQLRLIQKDDTHFDFVFEPSDPSDKHIATVTFKNVDVARMTPGVPEWTKEDDGLVRIALTDREWNRQQVQFPVPGPNVDITGGDGWEAEELEVASLAKNCLNGGLWEVLLFHYDEEGKKQMFYQGWFTFPMGHYARLVEQNTDFDYGDHWFKLEHWDDPAGTEVNLAGLRTVGEVVDAEFVFDPDEAVVIGGEQVRKRRTLLADNVCHWADLPAHSGEIRFATFIPPGTYDVDTPWENEYWRIARFDGGEVVEVTCANGTHGHELVLHFTGSQTSGSPVKKCRFVVGGVDLRTLPLLPRNKYPKGLYMPMGIGVPPFYQDYAALLENDPMETPYYSLLLDPEDRWIDHHSVAIDGPVMHRDADDPDLIHLYLLSYERHTLVGHWTVRLPAEAGTAPAAETL